LLNNSAAPFSNPECGWRPFDLLLNNGRGRNYFASDGRRNRTEFQPETKSGAWIVHYREDYDQTGRVIAKFKRDADDAPHTTETLIRYDAQDRTAEEVLVDSH
jgi:hypothetical protein